MVLGLGGAVPSVLGLLPAVVRAELLGHSEGGKGHAAPLGFRSLGQGGPGLECGSCLLLLSRV